MTSMVPILLLASASTALPPTPPSPKTATLFEKSASTASFPNKRMVL